MNPRQQQQKAVADQHYNSAHRLKHDGEPEEAIAEYLKCLKMVPDDVDCLYNLGNACHAAGKPRDATRYWTEALAIDPTYVPAHINLGFANRMKGQSERAVVHYLAALKHQPESVEAKVNLGVAYAAMGQTEEALELYQEVLEQQPGYTIAHYNQGLALKALGRHEEAIQELQLSLDGSNADLQVHRQLGALCEEVGDVMGAIDEYESVLAVQPEEHQVRMHLGLMLLQRDKVYRCRCKVQCCAAIPHLRVAAKEAQSRIAYETLATHAESLNNWGDAHGYWTKLIALDVEIATTSTLKATAHFRRGTSCRNQLLTDEAEADYRKCLQLDPQNNEARINLGFLLASKGDKEGSRQNFLAAAQQDPMLDMGPLVARPRRKLKSPFQKRRAK